MADPWVTCTVLSLPRRREAWDAIRALGGWGPTELMAWEWWCTVSDMVVKRKDGWYVVSEKGKK